MTLVLRWRQRPPPIQLRWRGLDGATADAISAGADPAPIAAIVGPPGTDGAASGSVISRVAGEALGGHRAVAIDGAGLAFNADPASPPLRAPIGVTTGAASSGAAATIQVEGVLEEPSWTWSAGPIYLAAAGMLTQSVPVSGALVIVGHATGPTSMRIDPQLVALLN